MRDHAAGIEEQGRGRCQSSEHRSALPPPSLTQHGASRFDVGHSKPLGAYRSLVRPAIAKVVCGPRAAAELTRAGVTQLTVMALTATRIDEALDQLVIAALAGVAAFIRFSASEPVIVIIRPQRARRMAGNALSSGEDQT
jgi:hypothetical protein